RTATCVSSRRRNHRNELRLRWEIDRGITVEEPEWLQLEAAEPFRRHHRVVLRARNVCQADVYPQHDIAVLDASVVARVDGQAITAVALVGVVTRGIQLAWLELAYPQPELGELGAFERAVVIRP